MSSNLDQKVYDEICDKLQIARHIISKMDADPPEFGIEPFVRTICYYTGVDRKSVEELLKHLKPRKTFLDLLRIKNNIDVTTAISFEVMRDIIFYQYVINQQVPTKASIAEVIKRTVRVDKESIPLILTRDLRNLGFRWKRLPKSDRYIIVENTKQFSNRMQYFQRMKEYRENNRVLIHVERTQAIFNYTVNNCTFSMAIIVVASPQLGIIDTCFPTKLKTIEYFLGNKLHIIPDNSVFVIEQADPSGVDLERNLELPTIHSQKKDMIKWLDFNNIPCDSTLHRGELFALIENHKVNCHPYYRFCEFLKAAGHDVILRPPELTYTKYFKRILNHLVGVNIMTFPMLKVRILDKINEIPQLQWLEEDQIMAAEERKIYDEDQKLELILDKLMESIKNKTLSVSDFIQCEVDGFDTEFVDNIICGAYPNAVALELLNCLKPWTTGPSQPGPPGSSNPGPSGSSEPGPSGSKRGRPPGLSKLGPSGSSKPGPSGLSNPGPSFAQPGPSSRLR